MFTVVAVDAKLEPLLKDYLPLYETAREEQIRMIRWNRQGGSVQTALPQLEEQVQELRLRQNRLGMMERTMDPDHGDVDF